jgi:putative spermidine/putrescine transport system permease protein
LRVSGGFWLVAPAGLFLFFWFVLPLARFLGLAFTDPRGPLFSFETLLASPSYRRIFANTLGNSVVITVITVLLAWPVAYWLTRLRGPGRAVALYCVLFPLWISLLVRVFAWMLLLGRGGPINQLLVAIGLTDRPFPLLFNNFGVLVGTVHALLPFAILPLYAAMAGIDRRLLRASEGLGAGLVQTFRYVYLPLILPGIFGAASLVLLLSLGFFVTPALLGGASALSIATLISGFITERLAWSLGAAASLVLLVVALLLFVVARRTLPFSRELEST